MSGRLNGHSLFDVGVQIGAILPPGPPEPSERSSAHTPRPILTAQEGGSIQPVGSASISSCATSPIYHKVECHGSSGLGVMVKICSIDHSTPARSNSAKFQSRQSLRRFWLPRQRLCTQGRLSIPGVLFPFCSMYPVAVDHRPRERSTRPRGECNQTGLIYDNILIFLTIHQPGYSQS